MLTITNMRPSKATAEFFGHLQTMSGTMVNTGANPVAFTAGLPAITSMYCPLVYAHLAVPSLK